MNLLDTMQSLVECMKQKLEENGTGNLCFYGIIPGDQTPADYVDGCDDLSGMAFVRLVTAYPANGVGIINTNVGNCGSGLGADLEVGILRPGIVMDDQGNPASAQEQADAAALAIDDMKAIRAAVLCCDGICADDEEIELILGSWGPYPMQGMVLGGSWQVYVLDLS